MLFSGQQLRAHLDLNEFLSLNLVRDAEPRAGGSASSDTLARDAAERCPTHEPARVADKALQSKVEQLEREQACK
eukprot:4218739-Prymnesium_polylepis.1